MFVSLSSNTITVDYEMRCDLTTLHLSSSVTNTIAAPYIAELH
jgi:hypothetical protein